MKKILTVIAFVGLAVIGFFAVDRYKGDAGEALVPEVIEEQEQEVEIGETVEGEDFTIQPPEGWTVTSELNELDARVSFLRLRSPDYVDSSSEYSSTLHGMQISVSKFTGSQHNSVAEFAASINPEVLASTPIEQTTVAGEPAIRYYWAWEGDPALITAFFHNGAHYGISLSAAGVSEVPRGFNVYLPLYQKVVDSFEFK